MKSNSGTMEKYLLEQFLLITDNFKLKRRSWGMPTEIIGGKNKQDELYFVNTGSMEVKRCLMITYQESRPQEDGLPVMYI